MTSTSEKTDILLLGSGGREHALLAKISQSPRAGKLYVAPGNGGMLGLAERADVSPDSPVEVATWALAHEIGLVVIGPEAPLMEGVADACRSMGISVFGPDFAAARMEGSKKAAKQVMGRAGVPTAAWRSFTNEKECLEYVARLDGPCVVKADGIAAGKGVIVAADAEEAAEGVRACFSGAFGAAGDTVLIEETLTGPECSLLVLTDGKTVVPLAISQDHKRAYEGDRGPNTGGMGVYSPVPMIEPEEFDQMIDIMERVVEQLAKDGSPFSGCLYGGFMLTPTGPKVLEFNARFGDPEAQVVLPRMHADLVEVMLACDNGTLSADMVSWNDDWAVSVVLASAGYPGSYETGKAITGIADAEALEGVTVYHAGTELLGDGTLVTSGGRVLAVTGVAPTFEEARERAYQGAELIRFDGKFYRTDIGMKVILGRDKL